MAGSLPTKRDIEFLFKKFRSVSTNKVCFDCTAKNPTWASVTYGVFICIDCSAVHRSLGVHLTFVRSTQLDTNWTWTQLRQMQLGGNANAELFFQQHNCSTKDSQQKYNSRAAQLYKEKLHNAAVQSIRLHGAKVLFHQELESSTHSKDREYDFFDEHASSTSQEKENANKTTSGLIGKNTAADEKLLLVKLALFDANNAPSIENRRVIRRRSGMGAKKCGGLGAKKITTNFAEIEKEAELAGKFKLQESAESVPVETTPEEINEQITSMRLVYEDLSLTQKKEEEKLKAADPCKAKQMERLGMGFAARSGISHSALNDMKTIQQESVSKQKTPDRDDLASDDFFELDFSLSSNSNTDYLSLKNWPESRNSRNLSAESRSSTSLLCERKEMKSTFSDDISPQNEKKYTPPSVGTTNEAQKKFGSAKSISSDQFFSDDSDNTWERSANLSRFEGSSSISSADYFNRNEIGRNSGASASLMPSNLIAAADFDDVKESVRQGVTKVAGRLSSLANGVMSTIQEKYGGY